MAQKLQSAIKERKRPAYDHFYKHEGPHCKTTVLTKDHPTNTPQSQDQNQTSKIKAKGPRVVLTGVNTMTESWV